MTITVDRLGICKEKRDLNFGKFSFEKVNEFRYPGAIINNSNEINAGR